jgi:hypothetical protein
METELKVYKVRFYREMLCETDITARTVDEAEHFFREGFYGDTFKVVNDEVVDEVVSVTACPELSRQISMIN